MSVLTQFAADARDFLPILLKGCVVTVQVTLAAPKELHRVLFR